MNIDFSDTSKQYKWLLGLLGGLFVLALFFLPYAFPPKEPVSAMSFDYGFSNKAGILLIAVFIVIFGLLGWRSRVRVEPLFAEGKKLPRKLFWWCAAVSVLCAVFISFCCGDFLAELGIDNTYFLPYLHDVVAGKRPYVDFEFHYGPVFLYLPYAFYLLIPGLSVVWAYTLGLSVLSVLGLYMVFDVMDRFNAEVKVKSWLYVMITVMIIPVLMGIQYEMFRFAFPFWCLVRLDRMKSGWKILWFPLSILVTGATSPEVGVVYFLVVMLYCGLRFLLRKDVVGLISLISTLAAMAVVVVVFQEMFYFLFASASGLLNVPFLVSLHLLLFFLSVFALAFITGIRCGDMKDNVLEISFAVMSFGLIPACLGRCDPLHVLGYGVFIVPMLVMLLPKGRVRKGLLVLTGIVYLMNPVSSLFLVVRPYAIATSYTHIAKIRAAEPTIDKLMAGAHLSPERIAWVNTKIDSIYTLDHNNLVNYLPKDKTIAIPQALTNRDRHNMIELSRQGRLSKWTEVTGAESGYVDRWIQEMERIQPDLVVWQENWENIVGQPGTEEDRLKYYFNYALSTFYTYFPFHPKYDGSRVLMPVVDYCHDHYELFDSHGEYLIYRRKQ